MRKLLPYLLSTVVVILNKLFRYQISSDVVKLFVRKEGRALLGRDYRNFIILLAILTITLLAIGFANGSLNYLEKKMKDPFVKFIDIHVGSGKGDISEIQYNLNESDSIKRLYQYSNVVGHKRFFIPFWGTNFAGNTGSFYAVGRTIEIGDPLLDAILDNKNILKGRNFHGEKDLGLIVTEEFLNDFSYNEEIKYLPHVFSLTENDTLIVPLPIIAVVKELPGLNKFAVTPYFYEQWRNNRAHNPFSPEHTQDLIFFLDSEDTEVINNFQNELTEYLNSDGIDLSDYMFDIDRFENNNSYLNGSYNIKISFHPKPDPKTLKLLSNAITSSPILQDYDVVQLYKIKTGNSFPIKNDRLTINFDKTDVIRSFKEYIQSEYRLEIDMARIEALENYNFITKLTRIISTILIAFSIMSICFFVSNLLTRHLENIKMNLGTFKAFGLKNKSLIKIYMTIINLYLSISLVFAFIISFIVGELQLIRLLLSIFNLNIEKGQDLFNLIDLWTLVTIVFIMVITNWIVRQGAKKILNKSPGDLIYNRL